MWVATSQHNFINVTDAKNIRVLRKYEQAADQYGGLRDILDANGYKIFLGTTVEVLVEGKSQPLAFVAAGTSHDTALNTCMERIAICLRDHIGLCDLSEFQPPA